MFYVAVFLTACSSEDKPLDNYVFSLAELSTNSHGVATSITLDTGETRLLSTPLIGLTSDTTYRIQALYVAQGEGIVLKDYSFVLSPQVKTYSEYSHPYDPLNVTTCWKTANYINFRLAVKSTALGKHYFGFHQTDLVCNSDGSRTMRVHLVHSQNNAPLYYTRDIYLSLPLRSVTSVLQEKQDSLSLSVTTFDGERTYNFAM